MTIANAIAALQAVHRGIAGVKSAPDGTAAYPLPGQIAAANLPLILLFPSAMDLTPIATDQALDVRAYEGIALVATEASGVGVQTTIADIWTLIDAFQARYTTMLETGEELDAHDMIVRAYRDEGQKSLTYRNASWEGFLFRVVVEARP